MSTTIDLHHDQMTQPLSATRPRVLVLDRGGDFAIELARAAAGLDDAPQMMRLRRPTRVAEVVDRTPVDVIVAGPDQITGAGLRRLGAVHRDHPSVVIVLARNGRPVPVDEAVACGATEVLPWPAHTLKLRNGLQRALDESARRRSDAVPEQTAAPQTGGRVFTVTSASGGCGKTFFATNFAGYLAKATGTRVLLMDLDLQFGEVSVALRIRSGRTIVDMVAEGEVPDLADAVVAHEAGYDVLCAPADPIAAEAVGPREAVGVIEAAAASYDYVVVDTPPTLNEVVLAAFDVSHSLVVMAAMDVPSLKNLRVFLQTLERLRIPADNVSLVLNKAEDGTGIELSQVTKLHDFDAVLPMAREVSRSINLGMPVVFSSPDAEVSRRLIEGAMRLVEPVEGSDLPWGGPTQKRPSLLQQISNLFKKGARR